MIEYQSLAMADISEVTRPRSAGRVLDTRVVRAPTEPKPDYEKMRRAVHGALGDREIKHGEDDADR